MPERRISPGRILAASVRLYHSQFGQLDTVIYDISDTGLAVKCPAAYQQVVDTQQGKITVYIQNTDILYLVEYLHLTDGRFGLKFYSQSS